MLDAMVQKYRRTTTSTPRLSSQRLLRFTGEDFLVGLDRHRADAAGQQVTPVPGLACTVAAGLARRVTAAHLCRLGATAS